MMSKPTDCARIALQLYSINQHIGEVGLPKALEEVAKLGYEGVEFAGYWGFSAAEIARMLKDNGLAACGTHVGTDAFAGDSLAKSCEFCLECGFDLMICPGGGNFPGADWSGTLDDWMRHITAFYADAAMSAAAFGCKVGLHNHAWEFEKRLADGTTYWDYFFANTPKEVCMEQDVGWTTRAGEDPCLQFKKYPGRSPTLHAKENGVDEDGFDGILGKPPAGVRGVDWAGVRDAACADGVKWFVVECERHFDSLEAVAPSFAFLKGVL